MALALDGSDSYNAGDPSSTSDHAVLHITTAGTNRVLYLCVIANGNTLGVSGGGLTWTLRADGDPGDTTAGRVYTAIAAAQLTAAAITVSFDPGTSFASAVLFGISGANTASPFDADASLPHIQYPRGTLLDGGGNGTITTSNANDFLIGFYISGGSGWSIDAPWTQIGAASFMAVGYNIVSATQSATTVPSTMGDSVGFIADAVKQASAAGGGFLPSSRAARIHGARRRRGG